MLGVDDLDVCRGLGFDSVMEVVFVGIKLDVVRCIVF